MSFSVLNNTFVSTTLKNPKLTELEHSVDLCSASFSRIFQGCSENEGKGPTILDLTRGRYPASLNIPNSEVGSPTHYQYSGCVGNKKHLRLNLFNQLIEKSWFGLRGEFVAECKNKSVYSQSGWFAFSRLTQARSSIGSHHDNESS